MPKTRRASTTRSAKARQEPYETSKPTKTPKTAASKGTKAKSTKGAKSSKAKEVPKETKEKPKVAVESYLLQVRLINSEDPCITRLLYIQSNFTFAKFHQVLQVAFGWAGMHMWSFDVSKTLKGGEIGFFGQGQSVLHLSHDNSMKEYYSNPDKMKKASEYTLADVFDNEEYKGKTTVSYEYDHGDSWNHTIDFLGRADPMMKQTMEIPEEMQVVCLGGEGHPCAEDCGSSPGWEELKRVFKKGARDPEGLKEWYKKECANGDPKGLDPYKWDMIEVNNALYDIKV